MNHDEKALNGLGAIQGSRAFGDTAHRDMPISDIIARCVTTAAGGRAGRLSQPAVRRIVLRAD
jgi:hypothetical protein